MAGLFDDGGIEGIVRVEFAGAAVRENGMSAQSGTERRWPRSFSGDGKSEIRVSAAACQPEAKERRTASRIQAGILIFRPAP